MTGVALAQPTSFVPIPDHGTLPGLGDDDHLQYALLAGRLLGQVLHGDTAAAGTLELRGTSNASRGTIIAGSAIRSTFDWTANTGLNFLQWNVTVPASGGGIFAGVDIGNVIGVNASTFIMSALDDHSELTWSVNPGFAVTTLFFARQVYRSLTPGVSPAQAFLFAAQATYDIQGSGATAVPNYYGFSFTPILRARNAGDTLTMTNTIGLRVAAVWNTNNATATIDFGNLIGVQVANPAQVLFGQSLGTERAANVIGLDMLSINVLTTGIRAVVRSALVAAAQNFFLLNNGGALSDFGNGDISQNDAGGIIQGTGNDIRLEWDNAAGAWNWNPLVGEDLGIDFGIVSGKPTYLFEAESFAVSEVNYTQIRFGFDRFAFGQTGTIGNQVGVFTAGPRTAEVAGGWADFLLTQGGGLNIGTFAMSDVAAWVINQLSLDNTAGSIADLDTLVVGGMTTSNPGITVTRRSALRVTGRHTQRGSVHYPPIAPAALGAGDTDDWAGLLTGSPNNGGRYWARVTGNATTSILTGIDATAVQDGDTFELTNVGSNTILLADQDAGSSAANRFIVGTGEAFVLQVDRTVNLRYDGTTSRWRVLTPPGAILPLSGDWRFDSSTTMADPGSGDFRNNNATLASVTSIAIHDISFKGGDASNILGSLGAGDRLYIQNQADASQFLVFGISGTTDNTTWWQIDGSTISSGVAFSSNATFTVTAIFA